MRQKVKICMILSWLSLFIAMQDGAEITDIAVQAAVSFKVLFIFGMYVCVLFETAQVGRSFYYGICGYGFSPVVIFPFILGADKQKRPALFINIFKQAECYYPKKVFERFEGLEEEFVKVCKREQIVTVAVQIIVCIAAGIIGSLLNHSIWIMAASLFLTVAFFCIAKIDSDTYHGALTVRKYISQGYLVFYLASQGILYTNENHIIYQRFEEKFLEGFPDTFHIKVMETIKHMYMIGCVNSEYCYPSKEVEKKMEWELIIKNNEAYKKMSVRETKCDLLKSYSCYGIVRNNLGNYNMAVHGLEKLKEENKQRCNLPNLNSAYYQFPNYKNNYFKIRELILEN